MSYIIIVHNFKCVWYNVFTIVVLNLISESVVKEHTISEPTNADKGTQTEPAEFSKLNGQTCQLNEEQNNIEEKPVDKGCIKTESKTITVKQSYNETKIDSLKEKLNNIKPPNYEVIVDKNSKVTATNDKADTL